MIDEIVKMLEADPFEPVMIHTSGGLLDKLGSLTPVKEVGILAPRRKLAL